LNEQLSKSDERTEERYEQRLALIKKMHEEQIGEMKRHMGWRENEVEEERRRFEKEKE
jgi:hypothetical protein